jgi:hypothetical protein
LEFKAKLCAAVGVQSEALRGSWSSKRSFAWQLEFKAKLCAAVGVQSEALRGQTKLRFELQRICFVAVGLRGIFILKFYF